MEKRRLERAILFKFLTYISTVCRVLLLLFFPFFSDKFEILETRTKNRYFRIEHLANGVFARAFAFLCLMLFLSIFCRCCCCSMFVAVTRAWKPVSMLLSVDFSLDLFFFRLFCVHDSNIRFFYSCIVTTFICFPFVVCVFLFYINVLYSFVSVLFLHELCVLWQLSVRANSQYSRKNSGRPIKQIAINTCV